MANNLNGVEVTGMVGHWLDTPVNGYLGSGYGSDPQSLIQKPMSSGLGDSFISKMKQDIPIVGALGAVDVYFEDRGIDSKILHVDVLGNLISVNSLGEIS